MKREDLKALNLEDAAIDAIMKLHGEDINALKSNLTTATSEAETLKAQLGDANKQIEKFKGMKTQEEVDAAVGEWKTKYEQAEKDYSAKLTARDFDAEYDKALTGAKVKYLNEVKARMKLDELKDANGKFISERFNEQIQKLQADAADLFESETKTPKIVTGTKTINDSPTPTFASAIEERMKGK